MKKIQKNKELKRLAILDAARAAFLSEGYVLANMDKIALEAQITKQTLYRYFPSKVDLFKATLKWMGERINSQFSDHLTHPDIKQALLSFATDFIYFHLSEEHIATMRLLIAESPKDADITSCFMSVGPDETDLALTHFFTERFGIEDTESIISIWTGMLLSLRSGVLVGMPKPDDKLIKKHVNDSTAFLLAALSK